jgi:hypothetical protein
MPTRRTVSLLTITQPEQSGGMGQAQSLSRDSGLRREDLTVAILYWIMRKAPPLAANLRGKSQERTRAILHGLTSGCTSSARSLMYLSLRSGVS